MTNSFKKSVSLLLAVLMVVTMLPVTAIAEEIESIGCTHHLFHTDDCGYIKATDEVPCGHICTEECGEVCSHEHDAECGYEAAVPGAECNFHCEICEADVIYSDEEFWFTAESSLFAENSGMNEITLFRENTARETTVTVLVYDNSANYGKDYRLFVNGEAVLQNEGSISIYDALRESSEEVNAFETDANVAYASAIAEQEGTASEDMNAADMLAMFDDLGVRAAQIPLTFAKGESSVSITIDVIDDDESEYDEIIIFAVLDEEGELVETAQQVFGISDDEEDPVVKVFFDNEDTVMIDPETGTATLVFRREGNLAESTLAVLYSDGEPLGYINFAPWQEEQTSEIGITGAYNLYSTDGELLDERTVTVVYSDSTETTVVSGADPELDAVPDVYATIPDSIRATNPTWFPDWAESGSYETETEIIYMGTSEESLFKKGGRTSKGYVTLNYNGGNQHEISTSGTGSRYHNGYNFIDSIATYDFTGIASIESTGHYTGVDYNAQFVIGIDGVGRETMTITKDGTYDITYTLPDSTTKIKYVYYGNIDPQDKGGGTNLFVPNGFKLNKRAYVINIDPSYSTPVTFYGDDLHGTTGYVPSFDGYTTRATVYISNTEDVRVNITYEKDGNYPVKLVGYKLLNEKTKAMSDTIAISGNSFTFDRDFLKKYESNYCWKGDAGNDGTSDYIFTVVPVFEKIPVDYEIVQGEGELVLENTDGKLYRGDYAVFSEASNSDRVLAGVLSEARTDTSDIPYSRVTTWGEDGTVKVKLDSRGTKYVFEPTYNANATSLYVRYGEKSVSVTEDGTRTPINGKLVGNEGLFVDKNAYSVNDYVTLMADAADGYITRWTAGYEIYYGDTFYYQLDGIAEHNNITVDFISEKELNIQSFDITGYIYYNYVTLESNIATSIYLSNTTLTVTGNVVAGTGNTVTSKGVYTAKTDENGKYTISGFEGVEGGKYTVTVPYNNGIGYATITLGSKSSYNIELSQFSTGNSYPFDISVGINGNFNSNMVILESGQNIEITLDVHSPNVDCSPVKVEFYFYASDADGNKAAEAIKLTKTLEAASRTNGEHTYWDLLIPVDEALNYTRLYVRITSEKQVKTYDSNGKLTGTEKLTIDSGLVDTGYSFINPLVDNSIPVMYGVPEVGGVGNVPSVDVSAANIPFLGNTDVSISSKTGGYFVTRTDPDTGVTYLICGYSFDGIYGTGSITDKYESAKKANKNAFDISKSGTTPSGSSDSTVNTTTTEGETNENNSSTASKLKGMGKLQFAPAFMFKFILDTGDDPGNENETFIVGFEMILGLDAYYFINIPFNIQGIPLFVSFSVAIEGAVQLAFKFENDLIDSGWDFTSILTDYEGDIDPVESVEFLFGFPKLNITGKAGVGYNSFLSFYLDMAVSIPIMFEFITEWAVGGKAGFSIHAGADLIIFNGNVELFGAEAAYGSEAIVENLVSVQNRQNVLSTLYEAETGSVAETEEIPDIEEAFNNLNFSVMDRSSGLIRRTSGSGVISSNDFKNTGVHLVELDDGSIMALYLKDNGAESLNYLSAVSSISHDGGKTWTNESYINDNTGYEGSSLQYDINVYELDDRLLITWSEADFENLISELGIDKNNITVSQVVKLMAAMNLRGRFFDKETGEPMGEAFTIAENSTVACGMLDAVQSGENVYVYYQRNAIPDSDNLTVEDVIGIDRTIAVAVANINDSQNWVSSPIRVENENGQQYRIIDVEPFVHDGILGEVIVLDRNGVISTYDPITETWISSNDDRQLYLRIYDIDDETGEISTVSIRPLTETYDNAENPQVVSNDENLYLFWNHNGEIVYLEDFVATENDSEDIRNYNAFVIKNNDGTFTDNAISERNATGIASHGTLDLGKEFTVSMSEDGSILLAWISDELLRQDGIPTDEIYGVMLRKVSNAEALRLAGIETDISGLEDVYQLWAEGTPVALTDDDSVLGTLDSICTDEEKGDFLIAYTKLNNKLRSESTNADVKAVTTSDEPDITVTDIYGDEYPTPGTEMTVYVEVSNDGFKALKGGNITVTGFDEATTVAFDETIWPGTSRTFEMNIGVPENHSADTDLTFTVSGKGDQAGYSGKGSFTAKYGAYFTIEKTWQTAVPGTLNDSVAVTVKNIGNAPGSPEIDFVNSIFGVEDEAKEYSFEFDDVVVPGGEGEFICLLEDTYMNEDQTARILISTGEGTDQRVQKFMPKPTGINVDENGDITVVPGGSVHEHEWSEWVTVNGVKSHVCATCGIEERIYLADTDRTEDEANPETGAAVITFGKSVVKYIENAKVFGKKRRG